MKFIMSRWRIVLGSVVVFILINLLSFGLMDLLFAKREFGELMLMLVILTIASGITGVQLVSKQKKNAGWSFIIGASLTLLYWLGVMYELSTHGWWGIC